MPTTTRVGVNYEVSSYTIPAYVKALDFMQRHYQYKLLVSRICADRPSQGDCILALFDWTHENIPPTPGGWPVVDNHVLTIIIRGHGADDQIADVFSTLATYAGARAFVRSLESTATRTELILAFVELDRRWIPFDVRHHVMFRTRDSGLASVDDLVSDPSLADAEHDVVPGRAEPYSRYISRSTLLPFVPPVASHGELQQPLARLRYEFAKVIRRS